MRTILAVVNDLQVGGTTALMPDKVELDDGGWMRPSKLQKAIKKYWDKGWKEIYKVAGDDPIITVLNGEPCDGNHHETYQLWTTKMSTQKAAAVECMLVPVNRSEKFYAIRGTPAHSGRDFDADDEVAKELGAYKNKALFKIRINIQGNIFFFAHKGPTPGGRDWTWGDTLRREIKDLNYRAMRRGKHLPDHFIWAHYHQKAHEPVQVEYNGHERIVHGYIVPGWQASTAYIASLNKGEEIVQIGMLYFVIEDGEVSHHWIVDTRDITEEVTI